MYAAIKQWFDSKGGFSHVAAAAWIFVCSAYLSVPEFKSLIDVAYNSMPNWAHATILGIVGVITWYKNTARITAVPTTTTKNSDLARAAGTGLMVLAFAVIAVCSNGCAAKKIHAGALNQADSDIYDTLIVSQAGIEQAKQQISTCQGTTTLDAYCAGIVLHKDDVNKAITSYNTALDSYTAYHAGASQDLATLQAEIAAVLKDVAALQSEFSTKGVVKQ